MVTPPAELRSHTGGTITQTDRAAIEKGEVLVELTAVEGSAIKRSVAIALVDAPPEAVFSVLTDYANFPSFMPYCSETKVQKKEGEVSTVYFALDFPWPLENKHYVLRLTDTQHEVADQKVYSSSWTYEPNSGNINDSYGSWEVRPYDSKRTFVRYTVFTDPGGKIPAWANSMASEVAVPKVIQGLRNRTLKTVTEKKLDAP